MKCMTLVLLSFIVATIDGQQIGGGFPVNTSPRSPSGGSNPIEVGSGFGGFSNGERVPVGGFEVEAVRPSIGQGVDIERPSGGFNPKPTNANCGFFCRRQASFMALIDNVNQYVICQSKNSQQCSSCCKSWGIHLGLRVDHATGFTTQDTCMCCANTCV
ncbi:hypothetical protein QR680_002385 [Steinernema hermaphroditum]|uniref:Uncharacterized protein n=1 Tax=Steinernema hermaphroditum TaxID=289476 RepID=A0AA39H3E2_9BILA|nr:hypothetical protein QR680_002385 [Steinernema hermaphroditum]